MILSYDRSGAKKNFCDVGVTNFMPKSWRKTSAYEIRTFQYGTLGCKSQPYFLLS